MPTVAPPGGCKGLGWRVALQGRAPGWTPRLAPRQDCFQIRLVGMEERKGRKGTSLTPAGPHRGLAGAEGVPFLRGSSDRSSFSDRNFLLGRRPRRHQQDPYGALLGWEMCPFFLLASNGRRDLDIWCLLLGFSWWWVDSLEVWWKMEMWRFHPLARLEGGPLVTKRSHLGGSPYGGVNFSGFDSICVNIDWSGSKWNLHTWHRV